MTKEFSEMKAELAAKILPAITEQIEWDDFLTEFGCPVSGQTIQVFKRDEVDIDDDNPEIYRITATRETYAAGKLAAKDKDEALLRVAEVVAGALIKTKEALIDACVKLGMS